jgi:hypothetical protein
MLGKSESQIFHDIDCGCFGISHLSSNLTKQNNLEPDDILIKLAPGIAKAIEQNNRLIESQLRDAGIKI